MSSEINNNENLDENIKSEISELEANQTNTKRIQAYAVIAFAFCVLVLFVFYFLNMRSEKQEEKKVTAKIGTEVKNNKFSYTETKDNFKDIVKKLDIPKVDVEENNTTTEKIVEDPFIPSINKASFVPVVYKSSSSAIINNSNSNKNSNNKDNPIDFTDPNYDYIVDDNGKLIRIEKGTKENLSNKTEEDGYGIGVFSPKSAQKSKFDPNLLLSKGTYIGCSLDTRLVSTIQGGISCTVSENVYSSNGNVLLIEKGSHINGFYKSGQMNDGMDRIFVVWQEIRTPNDIIIPVVSGASDELGGAGVPGYVDHHWFERFGASILLSVIDDAFNVIANGRRSKDNIDYTENSRDNVKDMANTALEKFINIEPTLYKNQGDLVGVYVNRDIDFSKVYKLNYKNNMLIK